jgi:hypothetical protein
MSVIGGLLAATAAMTLLSSGYLFGIRRGLRARDALREELQHKTAEAAGLSREVQRLQHEAASRLQTNLGELLEPLRAAEQKNAEAVRAVIQLVRPVLEKDRLSTELQELPQPAELRHGVRALLNGIAERGGLGSVVLCDESGLPLGCSAGCQAIETLAGTSSLLLILAERIPRHGAARPHSFVLYDEAGQVTLHRIFTAGDRRYLLSVVTNGVKVQPDMFEAAITRLRALLAS